MEKCEVVVLVEVYLLLKDVLEKTSNYELFYEIYVRGKYISERDIIEKYYISNPARWKRTTNMYIKILSGCDDLYNVVLEKHKRLKKSID